MTADDASTLPKLICIEDDAGILASIERLLRKEFHVLPAPSFEMGQNLIEENANVAIVLADLRLPNGKNGLDLLRFTQSRTPDAVRAIVSGTVDIAEMMTAINSSLIHRFILKPWDNEYFRLQMREALFSHSTLREKRELEYLSITDPVTGLKNHRYFQDRLKIELERATRHSRAVSLAMLDLDHFKQINDRYGHPAGDRLLRLCAERFLAQVRSIDTVARYGGEEFAVLMPDTTFGDAIKVAERLRLSIAKEKFQLPNAPDISLSISIGVTTSQHPTPLVAHELIAEADQALYQAKRQGRNQTVGAVERARLK